MGGGTPFQESIREFAKKHPDGIVITNPPFSLFREFIDVIMECNLRFLVIGNKNAISYKEIFNLIKENKLWLGYGSVKVFTEPNKNKKQFGNIGWFTNLDTRPRHQRFYGSHEFEDINNYQKYDNYDAININKTKDIPEEYYGSMGVPITFLDKYNPDQFEIIGLLTSPCLGEPKINGIKIYARVVIKRKRGY